MRGDVAPGGEYLDAVAQFLEADLRPQVSDKALRFRLLIASNLLRSVAGEQAYAPKLRAAEHQRLSALLESSGSLEQLNASLVEAIRAGFAEPERERALRGHLLATLGERLAVVNPRFERSMEIE